ncbi:MAG TPA: GNAT family N-acetyltransferase [Ohtaekwangia sp.]|uniref:GNAT family N-acetyltransferase n=1 Tax=Ohtaekwangia sp. TaxID=2066019 RepID=UPI002F93828B
MTRAVYINIKLVNHQYSISRMTITQALPDDLEALAPLFDAYRVFYQHPSDLPGATAFLSERITSHDSVIYIAWSDENIPIGFVQLYPLLSSTRMKRIWLLNDLYVAPAFRGLKVSVKLIDRAKQLTQETGAASLLLETAKTNTIGNSLYQRTDFVLDTDHNYYSWRSS